MLVSKKPTGTLLISDLLPGRNLYLLATGTGLAPFLSIVQDPETYQRFERVILTHGVRQTRDLAYRSMIEQLPQHEWLAESIAGKLLYYPAVSREAHPHHGRLTDLFASGQMMRDLQLPPLDPACDRAMICGSPQMLADFRRQLDAAGLQHRHAGSLRVRARLRRLITIRQQGISSRAVKRRSGPL